MPALWIPSWPGTGAVFILCRSEKAVLSGYEATILSFPASSVTVLQLARPAVQRWLSAYKEVSHDPTGKKLYRNQG